ncbi:ABC transporter ATP-binding protein [Manganibacter manganicus]|uniref:Spermidine/putrescine ABC transporter ATP-binding protein n=1 Tax=Manganibacter manganicus TaxID=1873176 RepID=A0A1V8RK32_9HYPH|nr:ABC transporter ATP-binding protein [Pseudaminobacter manganicus]OQM73560.1 spermidine/putrescine ABC transporter ATP-binding protein [Pseudaminobacter manganicus]
MLLASSKFDELRLDHMSRAFGTVNALRDVSLTVRKGEFIALLGPSGCGKSTALNCIAGLLATTGGSIYLDDKRIDQLKPEDRGFGMVFQNYALFPHMTVRSNIGFGLKMRGTPKAEIAKRVDEALGLVRLEGQGHKLPGQLSGGQQQRVAIARAIVIEPPLVLMDEPLSNLDAKLRLEMRAEIRRIHNQLGATTLYVTHDQDEALSLADRIVVLRDGQIRQVGMPRDLYESPDHLDIAEFMGYRNRLTGKVTARDGERATIDVRGTSFSGRLRGDIEIGGAAVIAARADDVTVSKANDALKATVETIEYRGREFVGTARTEDGLELIFHAPEAAAVGNAISLSLDPAHALIYAA